MNFFIGSVILLICGILMPQETVAKSRRGSVSSLHKQARFHKDRQEYSEWLRQYQQTDKIPFIEAQLEKSRKPQPMALAKRLTQLLDSPFFYGIFHHTAKALSTPLRLKKGEQLPLFPAEQKDSQVAIQRVLEALDSNNTPHYLKELVEGKLWPFLFKLQDAAKEHRWFLMNSEALEYFKPPSETDKNFIYNEEIQFLSDRVFGLGRILNRQRDNSEEKQIQLFNQQLKTIELFLNALEAKASVEPSSQGGLKEDPSNVVLFPRSKSKQ